MMCSFPGTLSSGFGQQILADSISKELLKDLPDTVRAEAMINLAMYYEQINGKKAHSLYEDARKFAIDNHLSYYEGVAYNYESFLFNLESKHEQEYQCIQKAIRCFKESRHYRATFQIGNCYSALARYYRAKDRLDKTIDYYLLAVKTLEKFSKNADLTNIFLNISGCFQELEMGNRQKQFLDSAIIQAGRSGKKVNRYRTYLWTVSYYLGVPDYRTAKMYLDSARMYFDVQYDFSSVNSYYLFSGIVNQNLKNYSAAILYYKEGYEDAKKYGYTWQMIEPQLQIGFIYILLGKYEKAYSYLKNGLAQAEKENATVFIIEARESLSKLYAARGQYRQAYIEYRKFHTLNDSLKGEKMKKASLDFEKKYESAQKEGKILQLEKDKQIQTIIIKQQHAYNYFLLGLLVAFLMVIILIYRNLKQRKRLYKIQNDLHLKQIKELEIEKKLMATEAVLKGQDEERSRLARDLHDGLGGMLSGIKYSFATMKGNLIITEENVEAFQRSMDMLDTSIQELRRVAHNMMPESLIKFGLDTALRDFCSDINSSGAINLLYQSYHLQDLALEQSVSICIYRVIQELVNNVIKHAAATQAIVQLQKKDKILFITVEDNGKGFDTKLLQNSRGAGWNNIRSRVDYIKGSLEITSEENKGTSVTIEIAL